MPDPMDELENFTTPGLTMDPLPAAEVRRRGTRMRRRNNVLAGVAAVAVVAVVATPLALLAGDRGSDGLQPAPDPPSVTWVQTIPADFPLTDGLPATNGHDGSPVTAHDGFEPQVPAICPGQEWTDAGAIDARQATYTGESEGGIDRALTLYPTEGEAELALTAYQAQVQACVVQTDGKKQRFVTTVPSQGGDVVYANHYTEGGDAHVVRLVRVGNAILDESTYTMGAGDPAVVQDVADTLAQNSTTVVDAMCVFAAAGCAE